MRRSGQKLEPTPKTRINSGGQSYAQTFNWNELGLLQSETYPVCGHATCTGSAGTTAPRTVSYVYTWGQLPNASGWAPVGYHPNGLVSRVSHGNGVVEDEAHRPPVRPSRRSAVPGPRPVGPPPRGILDGDFPLRDRAMIASAATPVPARLLSTVDAFVAELGGRRGAAGAKSDLERDLGLGSLERVELLTRIEQDFAVTLPDAAVREARTPEALARAVLQALASGSGGIDFRSEPAVERREGGAAAMPAAVSTLVEMARFRAEHDGDRVHLSLLADDLTPTPITYGELWERVRRAASGLGSLGLVPGDRVCLVFPTSIDFFVAFLGTLAAGAVPVPIYPPVSLTDLSGYLDRHRRLLRNAGARVVVADRQLLPVARLLAEDRSARGAGAIDGAVPASALDQLEAMGEPAGGVARVSGTDLALIQYTSGSTGDPKGVALTHANLLANMRAIGQGARLTDRDVAVSWLPLYHDMGLIGVWLTAFLHAAPVVLLSPFQFLTRPERWLWAFHRFGGTVAPAPNFGYELCCRKVRDEDLEGLDLSTWRAALNGAEPVRPATVERFLARFEPHGFRRSAMLPVFGLAENAVALTFPPLDRGPLYDRVDPEVFRAEHRALPASGETALTFVSAGGPLPTCEVRVVEPEAPDLESGLEALPERHEGLIVFRGPSAMAGYFGRPEATAAVRRGEWTSTGDLGYFAGGELYVTGRVKDLVIKGGRKFHPQDLEGAAHEVPGIRKGLVVAFDAPAEAGGSGEILVLVAETREPAAHHAALEQAVSRAVLAAVGTPADRVVLVPPGTIPKTSSGKLRRRETRERFLAGTLAPPARRTGAALWTIGVGSARARLTLGMRAVGRALFGAWVWLVVGLVLIPGVLTSLVVTRRPEASWRLIRGTLRTVGRLTGLLPRRLGAPLPAGAAVVVANHQSYLDALALVAALERPVAFTPKREVFDWPIVGRVVRRLGAVAIDRRSTAGRLDSFASGADALAAGRMLQVFAEGTFARGAGVLPFRLGAFRLAHEAGVPLVPVAIRGTRVALPGVNRWPRRATIEVEVLSAREPLAPDAGFRAELDERDEVRAELARAVGEPLLES